MVQITLTTEEARMLAEVIDNYVSELRMEIAGTENMNLRESLKKEEVFLKTLVARLAVPQQV